MSSIPPIEATVNKTNVWLHEISAEAGCDDVHYAYRILRAVLHALRDRLGVEISAHISAQLPMLVRGLFFEGWDPTHTPKRLTLAAFLEQVEREAMLKGTSEAEEATRSVVRVLWNQLGEGMMTHVVEVLPNDYATVF